MENEKIIRAIIEKCDIFYGDSLLSDETIIEKYLTFFARQFNPDERSVSFAFHTGSLCFDVVSVAALMIGCLAYEFSSNDEILAGLDIGDMVLYKRERYHWNGIKKMSVVPGTPEIDYIVLTQDAKGKNGSSSLSIPYERNKHLIRPYYGTSTVTDGRGVRKDKTNRNDFISYVLDIPVSDVPSNLDLSVVVVADKNEFIEICKHLSIRYKEDRFVELTDVVPVSYYTGTGEQFQIGKNAAKSEAVIKVTSKMSMARDLVLDKHGNRAIGLLVTNVESLAKNSAELNDLLRRKSLRFAYVTAPFNAESCELAMDQYDLAKMFACTKELLSTSKHEVKSQNKLTVELNRQISNILNCERCVSEVTGCWTWDQFKEVKEKLYAVKHSNWSGEDRDNFILSSIALINLFSTSFFSMKSMEEAISAKVINGAVVSPEERLTELQEIAIRNYSMKDQCSEIVTTLMDMYSSLYDASPKGNELFSFLDNHKTERIIVVMPKAYYAEMFSMISQGNYDNVVCVTANRFDKQNEYDIVIAIGDIVGKRFDSLQCYVAPYIYLFLYEFERKTFSHRKRKSVKSERKLNARIKGLKGDDYIKAVSEDDSSDEIPDEVVRDFSDLDEFVETMGLFDIRKLTASASGSTSYNTTAEVQYVGTFTTGEQIMFSKYYSPVVFNQVDGTVSETSPEKLVPGDVLVFTKRNDYTSNIVDLIFDQLMRTKKLNADVQNAAEKAFYWKEALREYKEIDGMTYRGIAKAMKKLGSSLQEVTIRQWLIEESHIVGPRDLKTMRMIAELTQDDYMLRDPNSYYEACRTVRHFRREILSLIAQAINDKLSNKEPVPGSAFEVVYENVDKLSETMELENIFELDEIAVVNNGMVNRPISEAEVLM